MHNRASIFYARSGRGEKTSVGKKTVSHINHKQKNYNLKKKNPHNLDRLEKGKKHKHKQSSHILSGLW